MKTSFARFAVLFCLAFSVSIACARAVRAASSPDTATPAAKSSADVPLVADKIREAMQDRHYAAAVAAIDASMQEKDAPRDYLLYLKGRALHLDGKYDDAIAAFDEFARRFPKSPWARRARFAKAVSLARKGDFRGAELIYRAEAEYLLSDERKQQLADIYLEFADTYFKPPKEEEKPDYAKALDFYRKALDAGVKPERQIEIELSVGECLQNLGKFGEAAGQFEKLIKEHPRMVFVWPPSEISIEARWRLGACRLAEGNPREARRVWQDLLAKYETAQSPRVADAQFDLSRTWNIPNPQDDEQLNLGTAALNTFLERFPKHKNAGRAHLDIAQSYLNRGRAADAVAALKRFLTDANCRDCKELPQGQKLLGLAYLSEKNFAAALAAFRDFLAKYPAHAEWSSVQQLIVETEYLMAVDRLAAKKYAEANKLFAEFLAKYPLDARNPGILLAMNQENVAAEKWDAAIAGWRRLVSKYPGTNEASLAQLYIAETLERKLGRLDEALDEYRKVTWGAAQGRAMQAAARLTAKTMTVSTERVFRSDETPRLKLVSRNIESVTVRVYKVDLETYFRKMHLARGVEGLDIALIDPDKTFEFKVPKYAKHQEIESEIPVGAPPLGGNAVKPAKAGTPARGVWAVTVSGKALEATTMVIQSDLDVIVKSSRDEVFVFAENMLTGKPWPGVRLLVSNGHEVIGEGVTGANGVFRKAYKDFPAGAGAVAPSNISGLPGLAVPDANTPAPGVAPTGAPGTVAPSPGLPDQPARYPGPSLAPPTASPTLPGEPGYAPPSGTAPATTPTPPSYAPPPPSSARPPDAIYPAGMPAISPGSRSASGVSGPVRDVPTPEGSKQFAAATPPGSMGVACDVTGGALRDPRLIAAAPPGQSSASDDPFGDAPVAPAAPRAQQVVVPGANAPGSPERRNTPFNSDDVRVFAVAGGNVASNLLNLQGVGVAQGLTDRGYIYTDRPAYRAGQLVNIRGCLRRAANDAYVIDDGKPYTVEVFDAGDRPIRQEKVKLDSFGSFHLHFILPPDSPQGQYRVLVRDNGSQNFGGTFVVHEYQLEPIRLVVDTPRRVYYRGEPIEGTVRAEFYYGAPVAGREIRYQLAGDRWETAKTDAKGEVHFKLDTRDYSESQVLPLVVQMPDGNVNTQVNFVLAAQGFTIGVSTVRPVYVTGETLEATVNVRDAENKPLVQKLTLKVLERTLVNNRYGERLVEEHELTTAADGKARQTLKLDQGGTYFLRAEAIDRFHNPISGQATVGISGEDDLVRLRILADRHTYKVGDTASIELFWREPPALALVTYQGARVLDYRLVELKTGTNQLKIPMTAELAPNFELAVAVMNDPEHGAASREQGVPSTGSGVRSTESGVRSEASRTRQLPGANRAKSNDGGPALASSLVPPYKAKRPIVRFHTASSPFTVERDLRVKITAKRKAAKDGKEKKESGNELPHSKFRPGDDVEVSIEATDPQGRPVAAELSLALVEQSLLERFSSPLPAIGDFFRGVVREPAVRCTSSITFSYRPQTQPINPRLLAEKDREEIAREEEESRKAAEVELKAIAEAQGAVRAETRARSTTTVPFSRDDAGVNNPYMIHGEVGYQVLPRTMVQEEEENFDKYDMGEIDETPPAELDVDQSLEPPAATADNPFGPQIAHKRPKMLAMGGGRRRRGQNGQSKPVYMQGLNLDMEIADGAADTPARARELDALVDQFNRLNEEHRYEEAEVIAKKARELAPNELVAKVMMEKSKIQRNLADESRTRDGKENGFARAMNDADAEFGEWHIGMDLSVPMGTWRALSQSRSTSAGNGARQFVSGFNYNGSTTISADDLNDLAGQGQKQLFVVDKSGNYRGVNLGDEKDEKQAAALAAELNASGAVLFSSLLPQETGYWNPAVTTGADGRATLTITLPDRSTAWRLLAQGITADTLAGDASDDLAVRKDLFGEIKLPLAFTDGDTAAIPVTVHNDAVDKGTIEVVLRTTIAGKTSEQTKKIDATAKGMHELSFNVDLKRPTEPEKRAPATGGLPDRGNGAKNKNGGSALASSLVPPYESPVVDARFELIVRAAGREDHLTRAVPLKPYGVPVFRAASGSGTSDQTVWVEAPENVAPDSAAMQIIVGPTVERSLLDIELAPAPWCHWEAAQLASGIETAASDALASLGLQKLIGATRDAGGPEAQALDGRIRAALSLLLSAENDDGGWSWTGASGAASNRYASCRAAWALVLVRKAGYVVPDEAFAKALGYLRNQVAATDDSDYESRAMLLDALAAAGQGDFALANRLYRDRNSLSSAALAYLALSFSAMDRKATAKEILDLLEKRNLDEAAAPHDAKSAGEYLGVLSWNSSPVEVRALYALALEDVEPQAPKAKELVDWLLAHRSGNRWSPEKATGPAALALCRWYAASRYTGEKYKLTVYVNDVRVKVLDIDPAAGSQTIDVPRRFLKDINVKGKQRVNFQIEGRGRYAFQCILGGFVPAEKLKSTTHDWRVARSYEPAPLELDGREIPRGFGVLEGNYQTFRNPLTQLPVGRRGMVDIELWRNDWNVPAERQEYLVVTEPIPSGATVIEKSIAGPFERYEIGPVEITFYVGNRPQLGTIRYELYGYLPGNFRAGPTIVRNAHRPEQLLVAEPKALAVLPQGENSKDAYRETPEELYELGKRLAAKKDYAAAAKQLTDAIDHWNLRQDVYKEAVETLLDIHLEIGPANKIVHYFEIVKEKWPNEEVPFAKIVKVGTAYHEMGEYERSYLVFRATVESNFARESQVAGFLDSQGEFLRSIQTMSGLLRNYPPEGYVAAAAYSLAQQVTAKAPDAANDAKLRQARVNKVDLLRRGWTMLESFLTAWPDDPAADQAAFAAASTLLDLKAYREAATACARYATRYAASDLVDSYWYIIGYCEFAEGRDQAALAMCEKVADYKHVDKTTGREVESPNKWQAIYILGQIYHGLGEAAAAIREYRRVEGRFADAKEAIEYFARKAIELPEVTTVKPGEKAEVELKFRNIAACDVKVYRIDLMKFSLLRRNLGGIAQINLAGIRPLHETSVKLGDGKDYRDRTTKLDLPLKDEGAYLVVCRGEDLHASGLVLVTPLAVEVQEDAASGRVRTTVKNVKTGSFVHNVQVKVIGSQNDDFVDGATDLRGVFVADGIHGESTVIARGEDSRYAFFRGKTELAVPAPAACVPPAPAAGKPGIGTGGQGYSGVANGPSSYASPPAQQSQEKALLENVQQQNRSFQGQQQQNLQKMYKAPSTGVQIQNAY